MVQSDQRRETRTREDATEQRRVTWGLSARGIAAAVSKDVSALGATSPETMKHDSAVSSPVDWWCPRRKKNSGKIFEEIRVMRL